MPDAVQPSRLPATLREIRPLDPPMVPFAVGGLIVWAIAGVTTLAFRGTLIAHGHEDWIWICLAGFLFGFPGLIVMLRHDAHRRRRRAAVGAGEVGAGEVDQTDRPES